MTKSPDQHQQEQKPCIKFWIVVIIYVYFFNLKFGPILESAPIFGSENYFNDINKH